MIFLSSVFFAGACFIFLQGLWQWNLRHRFREQSSRWIGWPPLLSPRLPLRGAALAKSITSLPDFFDLLAVALAAGKDLEGAFLLVVPQISNSALRKILDPLAAQLRLGLPREKIFETLQQRLSGSPASATLGLLNQALRHGSPLEESLRNQAQSLRRERQIEGEKKAQTIGLKLLIPIGVFIFPALLLLIFGGLGLLMKQEGNWLNW